MTELYRMYRNKKDNSLWYRREDFPIPEDTRWVGMFQDEPTGVGREVRVREFTIPDDLVEVGAAR